MDRLLLGSSSDQHPNGLANSSDVVGRHYMAHINSAVIALSKQPNPTRFQNTVCAVHTEWRPVQPLVFGIEYRQLYTRFSDDTYKARHLNLIFGFEL